MYTSITSKSQKEAKEAHEASLLCEGIVAGAGAKPSKTSRFSLTKSSKKKTNNSKALPLNKKSRMSLLATLHPELKKDVSMLLFNFLFERLMKYIYFIV